MGLFDRPAMQRLAEAAEDRLGVAFRSPDRIRALEMREEEFAAFASDVESLGLYGMDFFHGRPHEMRPERRRRLAQRSRRALMDDPLAGAEAEILGGFGFGKGIVPPTARDPKVQEIIDRGWCHDEETEALTEDGWLGYRELRSRWEAGTVPRLAAFDLESGAVMFEEPTAMAATAWDGEMVRPGEDATRRGPSFMVTPEHRMVTQRTATGRGGWTIRRAHQMRSQEYVPVAGVAAGVRVEAFVLPGCLKRASSALVKARGGVLTAPDVKQRHEPLTIPMDAWLEWLGWYIAEGSLTKPTVCQQLDSPRLDALVRACSALGVEGRTWVREGRMWEWAPCPNKQFREWLREHVGASDLGKRLPAFVFALAPEQRERLLDGLMGGDGTPTDWRERGRGRFYTSSEQLADDVQRLATLCGWRATLSVVPVRGKATAPERVVSLSRRATKIVSRTRRVHYRGDVWCFRMPSGTMVTRRDGTVLISGNTDANNVEKLTGYQAQRKLSNELLTAGELFLTGYGANGRFRVGRLDADVVLDIVPDPEDRQRPLYYLEQVRKFEWNFETHEPKITDELLQGGKPRVRYWPHWRNVDDAEEERALGTVEDEAPLEKPKPEETAKGVVYHVAINQTGEQLRGNPPWARTLRFLTAMNVLTESHVTMAQAASTFIARRVMKASPRQLTKAVNSVVQQASELGAGRWGFGTASHRYQGEGVAGEFPAAGQEPSTRPFAGSGSAPPFAPGAWWNENESSRLEALNLNSGAGQMRDTAQIVRAPIAAAAQFGQHYLGDASDANLATASTLELPGTMRITGWQKWFEDIYRWFTDRLIEEAVHAGLLGGNAQPEPGDGELSSLKPLTALRVQEAEDIAAIEKRTGRDLSYEFSMPFPGRRQLPEVGTFVQTLCAAMDPNGVNVPMRKILLRFAFEQLNIDDIAHAVEEAIPKGGMKGGIGDKDFQTPPPPPGAPGAADPSAPPGQGEPPDGQQPYGARSQASEPQSAQEREWIPDDAKQAVAGYTKGVGDLFGLLVTGEMEKAARELTANGAGK